MKREQRNLRLSEIQVNEDMWGKGATERIHAWLQDEYDPFTMPALNVAAITGKPGYWLLGWDGDETLLATIFGEGYAVAQMDQFRAWHKVSLATHGDFGKGGGDGA